MKWVFKVKNDGMHRVSCVSLGYSKIPGVDYRENFSLVVNDVTLRAALIVSLQKGWSRRTLDVETAFLEGDLEEDIFMKLLPVYEEVLGDLGPDFKDILDGLDDKTICELKKTIYGLVQAALMWYKKISDILVNKLSFQKNRKDPCLFYKNDENGEIIICLYVDDSAMMGEEKALDQTTINLKNYFTVTVEEMMNYVGYTVGGIKEGDVRVTEEEQSKYSSDLGFGSNYAHYKNLLRLLKFQIDTEGTKLKMEPTMVTSLLWKLKGVVNTVLAMDVDTIYFCEAFMALKSRLQRNVTLSSTEGEYVRLSNISMEIFFLRDVLVFMGIQINYPIIVHVYNTEAIF